MVDRFDKQTAARELQKESGSSEPRARRGESEDCRCKEVSKMSARQMLELMFRDLAFWKKGEKE